MTTLADAFIRIRPDLTQVGVEIRHGTEEAAAGAGEAAGHAFGKKMVAAIGVAVAAGAAVAGRALFSLGKQAVASARDLAETQSKVGVVFGKSADQVKAFAATAATSMGQSQQVALDGAAAFAIYGKAAGLSGQSLVTFSTKLTTLASDVGSFSNVDPAQVIEDFGSAMRGEFDPVEKYGILLSEATVKQEALKLGIIKTTKDALTPQQRVLAVQSLLYKQTSVQQGDFARTSGGLANQQRILKAQMDNLRSSIGDALLPVVTQFTTTLNTQLMPALQEIWAVHGPAVTAWLAGVATKFGQVDFGQAFEQGRERIAGLVEQLHQVDWATLWAGITDAMATIRDEGPGFNETMSVSKVVIGFLAEHAADLAKWLPALAVGYVLAKTAQAGNNVVQSFAWVIELARWRTQQKLIASNAELTAAVIAQTTVTTGAAVATGAATTAENAGILARGRAIISMVAQKVAMVATAVATGVWTAAQWLLNVALTANPIGLVIVGIGLLVAAIVWIALKTTWFQDLWRVTWGLIKAVVLDAWLSVIKPVWNLIAATIRDSWNLIIKPVFDFLVRTVRDTIPDAFRQGVGAVGGFWNQLKSLAAIPVRFVIETVINQGIVGTFNKVSGFFGGPQLGTVPMPPGIGDGPGPAGPRTGDGIGDVLGLLRGPAAWITDRVGLGGIAARFGDNPYARMLTGAATRLKDALVSKALALIGASGDPGGGGGSIGGLQAGIAAVLATLRAMFGSVPVISGFRPGSRTLSGSVSYHASGRAIDIAPVHAWALFLNAVYGSRLRELITPWNELNIHNGRPHQYTGAVWNEHNFAGGNAHIHAAMYNGGFINEPIFGVGASGRTYSFGERGVETVVPGQVGGADPRAIRAALEGMTVVLDGVRVGQLQGRYADLLQRGG